MTADNDYVEGSCYLCVRAKNGGSRTYPNYYLSNYSVRKNKPDVESDEIAMKISLRLPVALFVKPLLSAKIDIDGEVPAMELSPETVNSVQDLIRSQTGLDVELRVVPEDE